MTSKRRYRKRTLESSNVSSNPDRTRNGSSDRSKLGRRRFLRSAGGVGIAGLLAGCTDGGSGADTETEGGTGATDVDRWLSNTGNYDSVEERTDGDSVTVEVGVQGNKGSNAFAPPAVEISSGTTVTWEWVDGYHNVVARDGQFSSGSPERNATFERAFDAPGTYLYYCEPHESAGMKGAIIVEETDSSGSDSD